MGVGLPVPVKGDGTPALNTASLFLMGLTIYLKGNDGEMDSTEARKM